MAIIYCIRLQGGKYYVGQTRNESTFKQRLARHKSGEGSAYTKLYKPLDDCIEFQKEVDTEHAGIYEDTHVKIMMKKHGVDNVRGGSYSQIYLDDAQRCVLQKELFGATDACFKCGSKEHWVRDCDKKILQTNACFKCGVDGHWAKDCKPDLETNVQKACKWVLSWFV